MSLLWKRIVQDEMVGVEVEENIFNARFLNIISSSTPDMPPLDATSIWAAHAIKVAGPRLRCAGALRSAVCRQAAVPLSLKATPVARGGDTSDFPVR